MADNVKGMTMAELMADPTTESSAVPASALFGQESSEAPVKSYVPEEHRDSFISKLGDQIYGGMLNTALRFSGGVNEGFATVEDFFGMSKAAEYHRNFAQQAIDLTKPENAFDQVYYQTISEIGALVPSLPIDIMTGSITKQIAVGRILPNVAAVLEGIPDFALGSGWRGLKEGVEGAENPLQAVEQGVRKAGENIAFGTLYAHAGTGIKGIGKMASLGAASAVYQAAQEGRAPTAQEVMDGTAQGAAMGLVFTMVPAMIEGTQKASEKKVLREYQAEIEKTKPAQLPEVTDRMLKDERIRPEIRAGLAEPFLQLLKERGDVVPPDLKLGQWKDKWQLSLSLTSLERNLERVAGPDAVAAKAFTSDKTKENQTYKSQWDTQYRLLHEDLFQNKWKIKPGSQENTLVREYGEKKVTLDELKAKSPEKWQTVVEASKWYREQYDGLLTTINTVRTNAGYEAIPKRQDYFRHMYEVSNAFKIYGFVMEALPQATATAGTAQKNRPGKPFASVELPREGETTSTGAIEGFENYLRVAGNQIFHTDSVQRMRAFENYIRQYEVEGVAPDLKNFVTNIKFSTDILAGQSLGMDKSVRDWLGTSPALRVGGVRIPEINWWHIYRFLQQRTAANMVGFNFKTAAYNTIPLLTQAPVEMGKVNWLKGVYASATTPFNEHFFKIDGVESDFFTRRYAKHRTALDIWEKGQDAGQALAMAVDQFSVKAILAGKYFDNKGKGLAPEQAMKIASDETARMVMDRSFGQRPVAVESQALRLFTLFQGEISNQYSWMVQDIPQKYKGDFKKTFSALTQYAVYSWVFNNIAEETTGTRPLMDPMYLLMTLVGMNKTGRGKTGLDRISAGTQDIIGQLPYGNVLGMALGDKDAGRYPVSAGVMDVRNLPEHPIKELAKPLFYYAAPFGGGQAKKTIEGLIDYTRGANVDPSGDPRYYIKQDFRNFVQGLVYGKNAFPEAINFWAEKAK